VDLLGEHSVQMMTTALQVACVLLSAILVVLSVRRARSGQMPTRSLAPVQVCLAQPDTLKRPLMQALRSVLPARAPPDPLQRHPRARTPYGL
jgi:hypothetical protein